MEIPEHLLRRSKERRAILEGNQDASNKEEVATVAGLTDRLSGIVDMFSEPCSLLAEHIATSAKRIIQDAEPYIEAPADEKYGYHCSRLLPSGKDSSQLVNFFSIPLSTADADRWGENRLQRLELSTEIGRKKGLLGRLATRYTLINPGQAYLLAVTRDFVAVPIMGIRLDRDEPNCSFVNILKGEELLGEVVATRREAATPERQLALSALRTLLETYRKEASPSHNGLLLPGVNLENLGITQRLDAILGPSNSKVNNIITLALDIFHAETSKKLVTNITEGGVAYPGEIDVTIQANSPGVIEVQTFLSLPNAPSFGKREVFPNLRIYPASKDPLRFDGIDVGSVQHYDLLSEFNQLATDITLKERPDHAIAYARNRYQQ